MQLRIGWGLEPTRRTQAAAAVASAVAAIGEDAFVEALIRHSLKLLSVKVAA
jgi:hypothetical protein